MANHLTPTELARESGLERREVLSKCLEMGVPVFHGCIDKSLFMASLRQSPEDAETGEAADAGPGAQAAIRAGAA